jgi:hypothetical protein
MPDHRPYYAKSIWDGQNSLLVKDTGIKLGNYVEILMTVRDLSAARGFCETLGMIQVGNNVYTDGSMNIRLSTDTFPSPTLQYAGSNLEQIKAAGVNVRADGSFTDPNGLRVSLSAEASSVPGPEGDPLQRRPISRCGKFGELAVACSNLTTSLSFWEQCGFTRIHGGAEPYPYAILSDGLMIVGLHQTPDFYNPTITYFATDMADRIEQLQRESISMTVLEPQVNGRAVNAMFRSPDGQAFFLFEGNM